MRKVWSGERLELSVTDDGRGAWVARTQVSSRAVGDEVADLRRAVDALPAARMAVVVDLRLAPGRNDPEFEQKVFPAFRAILSRFARQATLVRTEVGKLQVKRLEAGTASVFTDEAEALRFLAGDER